MTRQRDPKRDQAFELFEKSKGTIANREIAKQLDVHEKTISAWKSRDKWNAVLQSGKCSTAKDDCSTTNKGGAPPRNKNAVGNKGNSRASPPKGNKNAFKHGLFAKIIPKESLQIAQELADSDPADILWNNIMIQYAAIIRAQEIMFVSDRDDLSKEESGWTSGDGGSSSTMQVQYAWDKQANFLKSQSRAMMTLSNLIKQFVTLADEQDERRKKLELMDVQIRKVQSEADIIENKASKLVLNEKEQSKVQGLIDIGQALIGPIDEDEESDTDV